MENLVKEIKPVSKIRSEIRLPGSKSITHRALIMAALADGPGRVRNPLQSEDTMLTAKALEQLGTQIERQEDAILVTPPQRRWHQPREPIFLGNSGTSTRLLIATASSGTGNFIFDGTARLRERPVGPVAEALEAQGVKFRWVLNRGFPPVEIQACGLAGGDIAVNAAESSQFLSGLLLAAPTAREEVRITWSEPVASFPYVSMTLGMMKNAGIRFERTASNRITIPAPQVYASRDLTVEGDCSSASYFWGAAAVTGGEVFTAPVSRDSLQGDRRFLEVLEKMGCRIAWETEGVRVLGPDRLDPVDIDMNEMPDMVPTLAVLAAFAAGTSRIYNVAHLRIKESDRLQAVACGLKILGIPVEELRDGLVIRGGTAARPSGPIPSFEDHRIAMAFALAGLRLDGVSIAGAECVGKSFPDFWDYFERLG
jgi:3-phosphoshikimate 1-carboxyvinyltransferase